MAVEDQVIILYALINGFLDDIDVRDIVSFQNDIFKFSQTNVLGKEIKKEIHKTKDLPDQKKMDTFMNEFKQQR